MPVFPVDTLPGEFLEGLVRAHAARSLPGDLRPRAERFATSCLGVLCPLLHPGPALAAEEIRAETAELQSLLAKLVAEVAATGPAHPLPASVIADAFLAGLPAIGVSLTLDARAHFEGDPAAPSLDEVILAYPGFRAVALYRIANRLRRLGVPLLPRLITALAQRETGIDINPGATIGRSLSIDHGTGVVIGETAVIGDRVKLYQGVTLGAASVRKDLANTKRHPTVGDDVVIYANATILGGETHIGAGSIIGGNVWLTHSVPPRSVVTHEGVTERPRVEPADEALLEFYL